MGSETEREQEHEVNHVKRAHSDVVDRIQKGGDSRVSVEWAVYAATDLRKRALRAEGFRKVLDRLCDCDEKLTALACPVHDYENFVAARKVGDEIENLPGALEHVADAFQGVWEDEGVDSFLTADVVCREAARRLRRGGGESEIISAAREVLKYDHCDHDPPDPECCTHCRLARLVGVDAGRGREVRQGRRSLAGGVLCRCENAGCDDDSEFTLEDGASMTPATCQNCDDPYTIRLRDAPSEERGLLPAAGTGTQSREVIDG